MATARNGKRARNIRERKRGRRVRVRGVLKDRHHLVQEIDGRFFVHENVVEGVPESVTEYETEAEALAAEAKLSRS